MALYGMRMRVDAWVPDELHGQMKAHGLSPSTLLQDAIRRHVDDIDRRAVLDELLAEYPTDGNEAQWTIWADETLAEHLERRLP